MNILVTGGAGYIGAELAKKLSTHPDVNQIIIYDNLVRKNYNLFTNFDFATNKIKFIEADLLDSRKLKKALKNMDIVFHLAALTDKNPSLESHFFEQTNHWGTSELINAIEESTVSTIIYASSMAVYGGGDNIFTENDMPNPQSFYATSKWRGEDQIKRLFNSRKCFIARIGNVYGYSPCMRYDGVINKFMFEAQYKGRIQIQGNGRQIRSYVHINDVVDSLIAMVESTGESKVVHLSDNNLQVLDIVETIQILYPQLEFIFINQHLKIADLQATSIYDHQLDKPTLLANLIAFKSHFSF